MSSRNPSAIPRGVASGQCQVFEGNLRQPVPDTQGIPGHRISFTGIVLSLVRFAFTDAADAV